MADLIANIILDINNIEYLYCMHRDQDEIQTQDPKNREKNQESSTPSIDSSFWVPRRVATACSVRLRMFYGTCSCYHRQGTAPLTLRSVLLLLLWTTLLLLLGVVVVPSYALHASSLSPSITQGLDLPAVLRRVGRHCGTVRGRQILIDLACDDATTHVSRQRTRRKRHRFYRTQKGGFLTSTEQQQSNLLLARSPSDFEKLLALVQEAQELIRQGDWPPLYGDGGPLDAQYLSQTITTDDDEWLYDSDDGPTEEGSRVLSLWNIYQAEQVVRRILLVQAWLSDHPSFRQWYSLLKTDRSIDDDDDDFQVTSLDRESPLHELNTILTDAVNIRRMASADPRSVLQIQLNPAKFPVLRVLQDKSEARMEKEREIQEEITLAIQRVSHIVDEALDTIGHLDVLFAKGSFGIDNKAVVQVSQDNSFRLYGFRHPLLLESSAVPIDLLLGGSDRSRALVISGPNGGGKSLALKSFGLAAILLQMGIPIGSCSSKADGALPFYDDILVSFGDAQDVEANKSTFTAKLEQCSSMLQRVKKSNPNKTILVLWDELLSGTDDSAGAAIGQTMLEELLQHPNCHVVATTHSPLLKTLSFNDQSIGCASVHLRPSSSEPTFCLDYGSIGQSVPYSAMTRTDPPFTDAFLSRVLTSLQSSVDSSHGALPSANAPGEPTNIEPSSSSSAYVQALTASLEQQVEMAAAAEAEAMAIRTAMVQLARTYESYLGRLEQRLQTIHTTLRDSPIDDYTLVGNTIAEVALVRKSVETEGEMLASRGLKRLGADHVLRAGDSVVIIDEASPWHDQTGSVEVTPTNSLDAIVWVVISSEWDSFSSMPEDGTSHRFSRSQLAIWDYDSIWNEAEAAAKPSLKKSKQTVHRLLASLETTPKVVPLRSPSSGSKPSFRSSRERKAANKKRKRR